MSHKKRPVKNHDGSDEDSVDASPVNAVARNKFQMLQAEDESSESEWDKSSDDGSSGSSGASDSGISDSGSDSGHSKGSDQWDSESDGVSSASGDEGETEAQKRERRMRKWLKVVPGADEEIDTEDRKAEKKRKQKESQQKQLNEEGHHQQQQVELTAGSSQPLSSEKLTLEELKKKITEIFQLRGKKGVDRPSLIYSLEKLLELSRQFSVSEQATIIYLITNLQLDASVGSFSALPKDGWKTVVGNFSNLVDLLETDKTATVTVTGEEHEEHEKRKRTCLAISTLAELIDEDIYKALQFTDARQPAVYVDRLSDVPEIVTLLWRVLDFLRSEESDYGRAKSVEYDLALSKLNLRILKHFHYLNQSSAEILLDRTRKQNAGNFSGVGRTVRELAKNACGLGGMKEKCTGILLLTYFIANYENNLEISRKLMSADMWDYLQTAEVDLQVLYNRSLASVGICAFKNGDISRCHFYLSELCSSNKARELLGQSMGRASAEKSADQQKAERRRQLPYHLHVDVEIVDFCHFLSAMLLEVPRGVVKSSTPPVSRMYRKFLDYYDRNASTAGPPENPREVIAYAGKLLLAGEVDKAFDLLSPMDVWLKLGTLVKEKIFSEIKSCALKAFVLFGLPAKESFKISQVSALLGIEENRVVGEVSASILSGEFEGTCTSFDQGNTRLVSTRVRPASSSKLTGICVEMNERIQRLQSLCNNHTGNLIEDRIKDIRFE